LHANEETQSVDNAAPVTDGKSLLETVLTCLDDNKAEDITSINLAGKTSIADHMVIANGRSQRQVSALAHYVTHALKEGGHGKPDIEGLDHADWVLLDAGDVIVHIFRPEVREFYNLDKMWATDIDDLKEAEALN